MKIVRALAVAASSFALLSSVAMPAAFACGGSYERDLEGEARAAEARAVVEKNLVNTSRKVVGAWSSGKNEAAVTIEWSEKSSKKRFHQVLVLAKGDSGWKLTKVHAAQVVS
jgi:hypothetical protein